MKEIVIACGSGIATSTAVAAKIASMVSITCSSAPLQRQLANQRWLI